MLDGVEWNASMASCLVKLVLCNGDVLSFVSVCRLTLS